MSLGVCLWQVLVTSPGKGMQLDRIQLAAELWDADIAAEFGYKANPNFKDSLQYADDEGIPFLVILGESEKQEVRTSSPHFMNDLPFLLWSGVAALQHGSVQSS